MNWKPVYAFLIFFSSLTTWGCGLLVESSKNKGQKKAWLTISLLINFGILFTFKYFNFINNSVFSFLSYLNIRWEIPNLDLLLPVGISFYTFQAVGYTIDVYRGDLKAERNFGIYALFVSFFPQLVAGPIERAENLLPQFREKKFFLFENLTSGLRLMLWGYFLKLVLADRLAIYVNAVYNNVQHHTGSSLSLASFLFAFQIYGDFAGYSLIAIGVAKIMGFKLMENFHRPYFAENIGAFWGRWHISLSTWFKDYLYIPLGGNRVSKKRTYFNLFITFLISGIWHGANFTFMVWGALHGFYLVIEKIGNIAKKKVERKFSIGKLFKIAITFLLVDFAWIFFRANTISDAWLIIKRIFTGFGDPLFINAEVFFASAVALSILLLKEMADEFLPENFALLENRNLYIRLSSYAILTSIIILFGVFDGGQFIYFQF
jgi:D-alanyl-lipoteichoic acid acyltransferase DltB (MBOAT superfamily)